MKMSLGAEKLFPLMAVQFILTMLAVLPYLALGFYARLQTSVPSALVVLTPFFLYVGLLALAAWSDHTKRKLPVVLVLLAEIWLVWPSLKSVVATAFVNMGSLSTFSVFLYTVLPPVLGLAVMGQAVYRLIRRQRTA